MSNYEIANYPKVKQIFKVTYFKPSLKPLIFEHIFFEISPLSFIFFENGVETTNLAKHHSSCVFFSCFPGGWWNVVFGQPMKAWPLLPTLPRTGGNVLVKGGKVGIPYLVAKMGW